MNSRKRSFKKSWLLITCVTAFFHFILRKSPQFPTTYSVHCFGSASDSRPQMCGCGSNTPIFICFHTKKMGTRTQSSLIFTWLSQIRNTTSKLYVDPKHYPWVSPSSAGSRRAWTAPDHAHQAAPSDRQRHGRQQQRRTHPLSRLAPCQGASALYCLRHLDLVVPP